MSKTKLPRKYKHSASLVFLAGLAATSGCLLPIFQDLQAHAANKSLAPTANRNSVVTVRLNEAQLQEIKLQIAVVKRGLINRTVESPGEVQPNAELSTIVSTPSAGRVLKVLARLGDTVKAGEVMAVIQSEQIGQVQSELLQNVLQAKADIKQQEVGLKLDHITFDRESILYKEEVSAKADLQIAQNQLEKDEANLAAIKAKLDATIRVAQERLTLLGAAPNSARKVVDSGKVDPLVIIRAPRAGLVIERTVNPGELNDGTKPLFVLANLSEVWLVANIFEKDVQDVHKGQKAVVLLDSLPNHPFPARIVWVGDSVNATTRTLPVRANVPNSELILKPNMFARIKVSVGQVPVLQVPHSAVLQKGDQDLVFVETTRGSYTARQVVTGAEDEKNIQITSGLALGERVVASGATALLGTSMKRAEGK